MAGYATFGLVNASALSASYSPGPPAAYPRLSALGELCLAGWNVNVLTYG